MSIQLLHKKIKKALLQWEYRYNRDRAKMISKALDFCRYTHVEGDYFEFGVFQGATFSYACRAAAFRGMKSMRYFALDSFEGFSTPTGTDDIGILKKGDRNCSEQDFLNRIEKQGIDMSKVTTIAGFFENTLTGAGRVETEKRISNAKAAAVYIDCDLYEPAYLALSFLSDRLTDGTVIMFDNWFLFRGSPDRGERKAFEQWVQEHPEYTITQFQKFGWHGESFIVNLPLAK